MVPRLFLDALEPAQSHATVERNKTIGHLAQTKFHNDLGFHAEILLISTTPKLSSSSGRTLTMEIRNNIHALFHSLFYQTFLYYG